MFLLTLAIADDIGAIVVIAIFYTDDLSLGWLAIAFATSRPDASVVATDISGAALVVARDNAARHGVDGRVRFVETSFLDGIDGPFDLVMANPPYVRDGDRPGLEAVVRG